MWTLNNIRITVTDSKEEDDMILVKLQPIDTGTVYQTFGYINKQYSIQGYVVGEADKNSIQALTRTGSSYELIGPSGSYGNFYVEKCGFQWMTAWKQSFRPDKSSTEYIYKVNLELAAE